VTAATGSALLLRQHLRRDRIIVPVWMGALVLMAFASASATETLFGTVQDRVRIAALVNDQAGLVALYGPILDPRSVGELAMSKLTVLYALFSCVLYVVVVRRHTRVEEESGRAELVAGTSTGRSAPLVAAVAEGAGVAVVLGMLVAAADALGGLPVAGSLWFGLAWAGTGLVATGTAAVACQLSPSARTCGAIAAALLTGAFAVRALGDAVDRLHWLSWLSPLGWNTQLRAWSDPRWWVPLLHVGLAAALVLAAQGMRAHRDLGSGLVEARPGRPGSTMASPWSLAVRLHRTSLVLWTVGAATMSLLFGAMAPGFDDLLSTGAGRELVDRLGGAFIAALLPIAAMAVTAFPVSVVTRVTRDEAEGRAELALASGASRAQWFAAPALLGALAATWLLAVCGVSLWAGYRAAGGGATTPALAAALGWAPAVWVVVGVALVGLAARAGWVGWAALVGFVTLTLVGELLELPGWLVRLSPYSALPAYPVVAWDWTPFAVLVLVAAALTAGAGRWFAHRDVSVG
jgi:polyether ionophore transport system permease protein